jgi:glycosyltransferase involved in cell wall biosynthesis
MLLSIVFTTYNRIRSLPKSLGSIQAQTYRDIEILVVDDGSTDGTDAYIQTVKNSRVRYIRLPQNQGASAARNRGIAEAAGDFILIWDSDDVLYPNALERLMREFEKNSALSVVSAPARILIEKTEVTFSHFPTGPVTLPDILCKKLPSNMKVRLARAGVMKQVSYKSRNIDFLVNVELIERGTWYHVDEPLGDVFNNPQEGSLTASRKKRNARYAMERAPYLAAFLERHGEELKRVCATRYADYCYGAAIGFLLSGEYKEARRLSGEAVRYNKRRGIYWVLALCAKIPFGRNIIRIFYAM